MQPVQRMQWAIDYPGLSTSQKLVLMYMAHHAGTSGVCWPSTYVMQEKLAMTRKTARVAMQALESIGAIVCVKRSPGGKPSRYRLVFDDTVQPPEETPNGRLEPPIGQGNEYPVAGDEQGNGYPVEQGTEYPVSEPNRVMTTLIQGNDYPGTRQNKTKKKRSPQSPPYDVRQVVGLNVQAWDEYMAYRRERRLSKYQDVSVKRQTQWLLEQGDEGVQQAIVDQTIRQGWQGLQPLKTERPSKGNGGYGRKSTMDRAMDSFRRHGMLEEDHEPFTADADAGTNPNGASTTAFLAGSRRPRSNRGNDGT